MLPQRRKSADEIAKLRESLGIPGEAPQEDVAADDSAAPDSPTPPADAPVTPAPDAVEAVVTEPVTDVPVSKLPAKEEEQEEKPKPPAPERRVRSLRKSEQKPIEFSRVETRDGLPVRRHDERELMEIRRIQAVPPDQAIAYIQNLSAPWPLVLLGYVLPFTGAFAGWFGAWSPGVPEPNFPALWIADLSRAPWLASAGFGLLVGCCVLGQAIAGWLAWKKPRSRHHAGFITIFAVLIAVFGIIHQFDPTHGP